MFKFRKNLIIPAVISVLVLSACAADPSDLDSLADAIIETETEEAAEDEVFEEETDAEISEKGPEIFSEIPEKAPEEPLPDNLIDEIMEGRPEREDAPFEGERPEMPFSDKENAPDFDGGFPEGIKPGARNNEGFDRAPQFSEDSLRKVLEDMEISEEDIEKILTKISEMAE